MQDITSILSVIIFIAVAVPEPKWTQLRNSSKIRNPRNVHSRQSQFPETDERTTCNESDESSDVRIR